jgi:hypothetical protein
VIDDDKPVRQQVDNSLQLLLVHVAQAEAFADFDGEHFVVEKVDTIRS